MSSATRLEVPTAMVRRLVESQFPEWSGLRLEPVPTPGWDNYTFRLGDGMSIRLPSAPGYAGQVAKEQTWLPLLGPHLPVPIPAPLAQGVPDDSYPFPWSVYRWLDGDTAAAAEIEDLTGLATDLANFLRALQAVDASDGPPPGFHNFYRGDSPAVYDGETRDAIAVLGGQIDARMATAIWEDGLAATFEARPVWVHGDVSATNLLVRDGRLCAVIDFGQLGVGDPACDYAIAWTFLSAGSRAAFKESLQIDDGAWARGRAWALWKALITVADPDAGPEPKMAARRTLSELAGC